MNNIQIIDTFLPLESCQYLITTYKENLVRSKVVDASNPVPREHSSRTSSTFFLPNNDETVKILRKKTADYLQIPESHIETLQLLRYQKGERYAYHHDYLSGDGITNQRVHTILVYLNDLQESDGGATSFFYYNKKVHPKAGTAVWFRNSDEEGKLIKESLHAGEEIKSDAIKYAINIWTRNKPI
jgi:prolyl 4-hydroxylase